MNLPNKLTVLRMVLIPFMMFFYLATFIPHGIGKIVALVIFVVAALTDLLDGKIARKYNLVTNLGKFLDPIADKILTAAALFMIMADGTIPAPYGVIVVTIIIAREFMVSALRLIAASQGTVLAADIWGKAKTMVQMIALPILLFVPFLIELGGVANWLVLTVKIVGWTALGVATLLTIISGANYLIKNRQCFKDSK
ncbi:MAG: CDP-diacylglycerol--glycerol-3-phosphate 3-phosphatidyltransferase [Clostridia bacterium]|nr:CDP-diacylglycerol--glycerol-3-phosphate 3-phosphatidyltransferase [Clostridia bacterium]